MLTSALGAQCMKWETSPAATELEEAVMNWLKKMTGLPEHFEGVIQDTASTSTLCAILTAREKLTGFQVNKQVDMKLSLSCGYTVLQKHIHQLKKQLKLPASAGKTW